MKFVAMVLSLVVGSGKWHQGYPHNSPDYHPQNYSFAEFTGNHSGNIDYVSHVGDHDKHDWWYGRTETHEDGYATHLINRDAGNCHVAAGRDTLTSSN